MRLLVSFAMLAMVGCATPSNETNFKKVKPKQRVYVGNVEVTLNGKPADKCELFMNSKLAPNIKLSEDGFVVYKTADRKPYLGKVRCLHRVSNRKAAWHTQDLELNPLNRPKKRKSVNYFGHISLNWEIDPDKTLSAPVADPSAFRQVGMVDESGEIQLKVQDQKDVAEKYIQENWLTLKDFRVETHLVSLQAAGEDEELDEEYED